MIIFVVSCYQGLSVKRSPHEVPQVTTQAVMNSIIFVVIFNLVVSALFYLNQLRSLGDLMKIDSLKFEGVTFTHDGQDPIVQNVDFDFPMNEILWVKAEEGMGKSSLLQVLAGLQIPQSGKYLINGENAMEMSFEEFLPYRLSIGYSFDYGGLINNKTIYENLMLPLLYHKVVSPQEAHERIQGLMKEFGAEKVCE